MWKYTVIKVSGTALEFQKEIQAWADKGYEYIDHTHNPHLDVWSAVLRTSFASVARDEESSRTFSKDNIGALSHSR